MCCFCFSLECVISQGAYCVKISFFRVMKVAKKFADDGKTVNFAVSSNKDFSHELSEFGVDGASFDKPVVLARDGANQKYVMSDEFR